jgi:hypothetical protein
VRAALALVLFFTALNASGADVAKPAAIYLGLSAADLASTEWALANGATEGNPFMASHRVPKQLAMAAALTAVDVHLQRKGQPGKARALRIVYAVIRVAAVAVNVHNARRER